MVLTTTIAAGLILGGGSIPEGKNMMQIKIKIGMRFGGVDYAPGSVVEISPSLAAEIIGLGRGEAVTDEPTPKSSGAITPADEMPESPKPKTTKGNKAK